MRLPKGWEDWPLQRKIETLDPRMKEWIQVYAKTGNATAATKVTYPDMNPNSAMAYGSRVKARPMIRAIIRELGMKIGLTKNTILTALHEEIFQKPAKTPAERGIRLNAIDKASKLMGWYADDKGVSAFSGLPQIIDYKRTEELPEKTDEDKIKDILSSEEEDGSMEAAPLPEDGPGLT